MDTSGSDAKIAPQKLERFAISEMAKMRMAEVRILMTLYIQDI